VENLGLGRPGGARYLLLLLFAACSVILAAIFPVTYVC
jgi:hypothetical protein